MSTGAVVPCHERTYARVVKPAIDRIAAVVLIAILAVPMGIFALMVWATMGRPVLFRQKRIGKDGVPFVLLKFRSMRPDRRTAARPVDVDRRAVHKTPDDPRHTSLGRLLRSYRFDELPQLFHLLSGKMSLIGPRPELMEIVERYEPWQHERHAVRPGLSGLWQVSAAAHGLMHENTALDIQYVRTVSLRTDLKVMLRTPLALVLKKGF